MNYYAGILNLSSGTTEGICQTYPYCKGSGLSQKHENFETLE